MADNNKVRFGLKNVFYAKRTVTNGTVSYGTPVAIPGAVNLDLAHDGALETFRADDTNYYVSQSNNGYTGSIEIAKVPDAMYTDIFGMKTEEGNIVESVDDTVASFALLFQVSGDAEGRFNVLFNVSAQRPNIGSATTDTTITPQTQTMDLVASASEDGKVRAFGPETDGGIAAWFTALVA